MKCKICNEKITSHYLLDKQVVFEDDNGLKEYIDTPYHSQCYIEQMLKELGLTQ